MKYTQGGPKASDRLEFRSIINNDICKPDRTWGHEVDGRGKSERIEEL